MKRFTAILLCLLMVGVFAVKQTLGFDSAAESLRKTKNDKPLKLKGYDELWKLVEAEIDTAVRCGVTHTVIAITKYNHKTVDAVIDRLKDSGYTIQTNSNKKVRLAMVVSWSGDVQ